MNRPSLFARVTELVLLFLFSIPALSPLFTTTPTASADGLLHLYRLVQLDALWQHGVFFSRWLPDLAYGYGMPLFNYYAPLVYYLTTPLHLLGIPFTLALNLSLAAALYVGAVGMFYFARALTKRLSDDTPKITFAALIAAVAYLYSPYLLFNALHRANLAEQWALAFAPFALWRFYQLTQTPTARNWVYAVLTFAAVMLSHNVTSFLFAPLLFFFTFVTLFSNNSRFSFLASPSPSLHPSIPLSRSTLHALRFPFLIPLSAFLLALGLSAFFWLPALLERDFVQITRVIVTPDFDYRYNFVTPAELISFLPRADTGRMNPAFPSTLGVFQILGALAGILVLVRNWRTQRALPFYTLALAAFGFIFLMLSLSQPIWDNVSLLSFVQLPMRLRGLTALCLTPLIGVFTLQLVKRWSFVRWVFLVTLVLYALPILYPRYATDVPTNPSLPDMFAYEQSSGALGTTSFGEYLPVWVQNPPDKSPFDVVYNLQGTPNRLVTPQGVDLCGATVSPTAQIMCVTSQDSWHAIYQAFFFSGWQVTLDGRPLAISPTPRTGLITFTVPTSGTLRIEYAGTLIEHLADYLSLASAIAILIVVAFAFRKRAQSPISGLHSPIPPPALPNRAFLLSLLGLALALIAFKTLYADRTSNPFVAYFDGIHVQGITIERQAWFNEELYLLGFDINNRGPLGSDQPQFFLEQGDTLRIAVYWRALPGLKRNLSTYVHLTDSTVRGNVIAQEDSLHPGNLPTARWTTDAYIQDIHEFQIPPTLAPRVYYLFVGVYDPQTNERLQTSERSDEIFFGRIVVREKK